MNTPRARWIELFAVDLRSLALFRIGLAVAILCDLALRSPDLTALYTDHGVLPREALTVLFSANSYASIHFYAGVHPALTATVFLLHAAAALILLVGHRTRIFTALCWYLALSLNIRNQPAASMGGDHILSLCLFWGMFLPLGARFSLDARRAGAQDAGPDTLVCVPGAALLLQTCFIYWSTALLKSGELWWSGRALFYALHLHDLATPAGVWLREIPAVLPLLTYSTLAIEGLGPFLAFVPIWNGPLRTATVLLFWTFHLGLALFMSIGLFPLFSMIAWLPFVPGWLWERIGAAPPGSLAPPHPHAPPKALSLASGALLAYVTLLLLSNTAALGRPFLPHAALLPARILKIDQQWSMFAPEPQRRSDILTGEATLADGARLPVALGSSMRWKLYLSRVYAAQPREAETQLRWHYLTRYLCRDWQTSHRGSAPLARLDFVVLATPIFDDHVGPTERVPIFSSGCGG